MSPEYFLMTTDNKIIIFDLWQTLADSALKPLDLFDILFKFNKIMSKDGFCKILFKSDLYLKDLPLEKGLENLMSWLNQSQ